MLPDVSELRFQVANNCVNSWKICWCFICRLCFAICSKKDCKNIYLINLIYNISCTLKQLQRIFWGCKIFSVQLVTLVDIVLNCVWALSIQNISRGVCATTIPTNKLFKIFYIGVLSFWKVAWFWRKQSACSLMAWAR